MFPKSIPNRIVPALPYLHKRAMSTHYSAIIIGSGQGGGPLAQACAKAGQKTALIESTHTGGTCVNEGCTPTKTMVASARVAHLTSRAPDYGTQYKRSSLVIHMETIRKRKRDIVDSFRTGGENRIKSTENLDLIMGKASFAGPKELSVQVNNSNETKSLTADKIFINAGCFPSPLTAKNAEKVKYLNSTSVMELDQVPKHLVIIGGGYVGVEFAQIFRRFGAKVSIIQRGDRILPREDPDISAEVQKILSDSGIEIHLSAKVDELSNIPTGQTVVSITRADSNSKNLLASHVLAAAGRTPATSALNLSAAGIDTDGHGFIKVQPDLSTTATDVYALGDIKGGPQFTHISFDDFRILRDNLLTTPPSSAPKTTTNRLVPYTIFMDPQLGRVGHSETTARQTFPTRNIKVAKMPMEYVARALETDETKGFMKAVVDGDTKEILGYACLGVEGGEIMSQVQIAMMGGLTYDKLQDGVFSHPCFSESLNNLWGFLE